MKKIPKVRNVKTIAATRIFHIEALDVEFSNGVKRRYERLNPRGSGSVLVVPMRNFDTVLMIYEYSGGTERYELALPKGRIDRGETPEAAANRELSEEVGFGARKITLLKTITLAPGYQANATHILLAEDLYPQKSAGDEPEPIEVVPYSLVDLEKWVHREDLTEARSIAALYMARDFLRKNSR